MYQLLQLSQKSQFEEDCSTLQARGMTKSTFSWYFVACSVPVLLQCLSHC